MTNTPLLRRLGISVLTVILGTVALFLILAAVPGDVVQQLMGNAPNPEAQSAMREFFGLDKPLVVQYWDWISAALQGSLGISWFSAQSVTSLVGSALLVTLELTALTLIIAVVIGIPLGLVTGISRRKSVVWIGQAFSAVALSTPMFWLALLLLIGAAQYFHWSPPISYSTPTKGLGVNLEKMILPAISFAFLQIGAYSQFVRDLVAAQLNEQYVIAARAKGISVWRLLTRHIFRNIAISVVTFVGLIAIQILGGAIVIEAIFGLPGLGLLLLDAINARDFPVLRGGLLVVIVLAVAINFLVDSAYEMIDPRLRQPRL